MSIIPDLVDLFADTFVAQPIAQDEYGEWVPSGAGQAIPCYIAGSTRLIRDNMGREVTSSVHVVTAGYYALDVDHYMYFLPSRFVPSGELRAIAVQHAQDEDGPHHQTVYFR